MNNIVVDTHERFGVEWTGMGYFLTVPECKFIYRDIVIPNDILEFNIGGILGTISMNHRRSNV